MNKGSAEPSVELYNRVRAGFILQGSNLSSWCKEQGLHPTNAKACLVGMWGGAKGRELRERILRDAKIPQIVEEQSNA
tara:strand:- start:203 stop:436 length:234 start_codon:yes stop_codon:yes gene_type:complete